MTEQDEVLRLAEKAEEWAKDEQHPYTEEMLIDAARLLREQHAEIERLREQLRLANIDALNESAENAALRAAVLAEREACAKLCEEDGLLWGQRYAAAIRERGEPCS